MTSDYFDLKDVMRLGERFEIHMLEEESEDVFRGRVARAMLDAGYVSAIVTEILTGFDKEDWTEHERALDLGIHILQGAVERKQARAENDTYYGISWPDFKQIVESNGFESVHSYPFNEDPETLKMILNTDPENDISQNEFGIWVNRKYGMLLHASSYLGNMSVGDGNMHYEVQKPSEYESDSLEGELQRIQFSRISNIRTGTDPKPVFDENDALVGWAMDRNVGAYDRLIGYINTVRNSGFKLNNPWRHFSEHRLHILDYVEGRRIEKSPVDYRTKIEMRHQATMKNLQALPPDVQDMIGMPKLYTGEGK